jgi:hypothetical protein
VSHADFARLEKLLNLVTADIDFQRNSGASSVEEGGDRKPDPRCELADSLFKALPKGARRALLTALRHAGGERLQATWYEYPLHSNFDKFDRERLRQAAERAGLVEYRGAPYVTVLGYEWATGKSV